MAEPAGRELDAAVAERCFGYAMIWINDHAGVGHPYLVGSKIKAAYHIRHYSENMADAWQVAEWIREQTGNFLLRWDDFTDIWTCEYMVGTEPEEITEAPTAAEAICRAALKLAERMEQETSADE